MSESYLYSNTAEQKEKPRAEATNIKKPAKKNIRNTPAPSKVATASRSMNMPSIQQFIDRTFEHQLSIFHKSGTELKKGNLILAKMKGYDPWPARIIELNKCNMKCYFYGANNTGSVGRKHVIPFADAFETVRLICVGRKRHHIEFVKGIREIEILCGIPKQRSCLREFESIE